MERQTADAFAEHLDDRIDRRVKTGAKDKGDVANVRTHDNQKVVIECKDVATMSLGTWVNEAEVERVNDQALAAFVVHKRRGKGDPLEAYVTGTLRDLIAILSGKRPD